MKCLKCSEEMYNNTIVTKDEEFSYDVCEECGGLWLDKGELDKMAFQVEGSVESSSKKKAFTDEEVRTCPRCDIALDKVNFIGYSDVVLDRCANCSGFWIDGGELEKINKELSEIMEVTGEGFYNFIKNGHFPMWHKRIRKKSSETDFKYQTPPVKGAKQQGESMYVCPACIGRVGMDTYRLNDVRFEACPQCNGVFLEQDELRRLKDRAGKGWLDLRWMDDEVESLEKTTAAPSGRMCPHCENVETAAANYGETNVVVDVCPKCKGIWLDYKEIDEIIEYHKKELVEMSSAEMKEKLKQEFREIFGGPESTWDEILDAKAALLAFINVSIFEHPTLAKMLIQAGKTGRSAGLS